MDERTHSGSASDFASQIVIADSAVMFTAATAVLDIDLGRTAVSDFRGAVRRLRADLRTFRPLLDSGLVDNVRAVLLRFDLHAEEFEAFDTALDHWQGTVAGEQRIRPELTSRRTEAGRVLRSEVIDELRNGSLLHRLGRHGVGADDGESARLAAVQVLPGCLRRLWRHITGSGTPGDLVDVIGLAVWAEKGTYAAEASARAMGDPAARLATACRELWALLSPIHSLETSRRVVALHLAGDPGYVVTEHMEAAARTEWSRISTHWPTAVGAVIAADDATVTPRGGRTIRGGGGVVWRKTDGDVEVLLVHRHNRHGWSLPKGKCLPGESAEACALREVKEETNLTCALGAELPIVEYRDRNGRPKIIRYWAMEVIDGEAIPAGEVDQLAWRPLADARITVAKDRECKLFDVLDLTQASR